MSRLFVTKNVGTCRPWSLKITCRTLKFVRGSVILLSYILNLLNLRFSFFMSTLIQSFSGMLFASSINFLPRLLNVMNLISLVSRSSRIHHPEQRVSEHFSNVDALNPPSYRPFLTFLRSAVWSGNPG